MILSNPLTNAAAAARILSLLNDDGCLFPDTLFWNLDEYVDTTHYLQVAARMVNRTYDPQTRLPDDLNDWINETIELVDIVLYDIDSNDYLTQTLEIEYNNVQRLFAEEDMNQ